MATFRFGPGLSALPELDSSVLGGKGANLVKMCNSGFPVPPGIIIPTGTCNRYRKCDLESQGTVMEGLMTSLEDDIEWLEQQTPNSILVSVRSGARVSMPGMMDTVLNVGMSLAEMDAWENELGDHTAWDSFRRLLQMYATVVLGAPAEIFESILVSHREEFEVNYDSELSLIAVKSVVQAYLTEYDNAGFEFPQDGNTQLRNCIEAVFKSWDNPRAKHYRRMHGIPEDWGTAVNIQVMVFGNRNDRSGSGVLFTRNPSTGAKQLTGEFLINAQGEDVVAGIRTPIPLSDMGNAEGFDILFHEIANLAAKAEYQAKDMQDMEFTIDDGKLWMLQTRSGKRTAQAAFAIALDLHHEGRITITEAMSRLTYQQWSKLRGKKFVGNTPPVHTIGIPAGGSIAAGKIVKTSEDAVLEAKNGPVILVTEETTPDDIAGMEAAEGILTMTGGATSHAAVVARGLDKTCVVGCKDAYLSDFPEGTGVAIDGITGEVWLYGNCLPQIEDKELPKEAINLLALYADQMGATVRTSDYIPGLKKVEVPVADFSKFSHLMQLVAKYHEAGADISVNVTPIDYYLPQQDKDLLLAFGQEFADPTPVPAVVEECKQHCPYVRIVQDGEFQEVDTIADILSFGGKASPKLIIDLGGKEMADQILSLVYPQSPNKGDIPEGRSVADLIEG